MSLVSHHVGSDKFMKEIRKSRTARKIDGAWNHESRAIAVWEYENAPGGIY